jgi:GT2 family glycosyltransferase
MNSRDLRPGADNAGFAEQRQEIHETSPQVLADLPLVSVVVLNYKRRDALAETLDSVLRQDYLNREIIVVDNHSEEDIRSVVESRGSEIRLLELPRNLGSCAGRNAGIRLARGEFIITIDNDVALATPFEIFKVVKAFEERPQSHVLVFQICDAHTGKLRLREWCHPKYWKEFGQSEFETYFLPEGSSAFRRQVFETVGLYYEPFFIGHEGGDLAFRILNHGFQILYLPQVRVWHAASPLTRSQSRTYRLYTRNYIWMAYKNFRALAGFRFILPKLAMMFCFAVRAGCTRDFLVGFWEGIVNLAQIRPDRTPMDETTVQRLHDLDRGRPNWRLRLERHKVQTQI